MFRTTIPLLIVCIAASTTVAKDLCVQIDSGSNAGSLLVMKKAKVSRRSTAPVQGYFAKFSGGSFSGFTPMYGQYIVNSLGIVAFGITLQTAEVAPNGSGDAPGAPQSISMRCFPGTDTTVNLLDSCVPYFNAVGASAHVVNCPPDGAP